HDLRPGRRAGPHPPVQPALRLRAALPLPAAARRPALDPARPHRADRAGDRRPPGRARGLDQDQDERPRRRGDDRRALPGEPGGGAGRRRRPRDLRRPRRDPGPEREHPGPVDPRPVPRALADLRLRRGRGAARRVDRQRRPHAPQPRPPGRGAREDRRPEPGLLPRRPARPGRRADDVDLAPAARRHVAAAPVRGGRPAARGPPGAPHRPRPTPRGGDAMTRTVYAAGTVVWRLDERKKLEVLLVHRPRYDDWSWPKGKQEEGETLAACAVRETEEEAGVAVILGQPLPKVVYKLGDGSRKEVH